MLCSSVLPKELLSQALSRHGSVKKANLRLRLFALLQATKKNLSFSLCWSKSLQVSGHFALEVNYLLLCTGKESAGRKKKKMLKKAPLLTEQCCLSPTWKFINSFLCIYLTRLFWDLLELPVLVGCVHGGCPCRRAGAAGGVTATASSRRGAQVPQCTCPAGDDSQGLTP